MTRFLNSFTAGRTIRNTKSREYWLVVGRTNLALFIIKLSHNGNTEPHTMYVITQGQSEDWEGESTMEDINEEEMKMLKKNMPLLEDMEEEQNEPSYRVTHLQHEK